MKHPGADSGGPAMDYGVPISPGVVVGPAYCLYDSYGGEKPARREGVDTAREIVRFQAACDAAASALSSLVGKTSQEIGEREADIFRAHLHMIRDRAFVGKVTALIAEKGYDSITALRETLAEYEMLFAEIRDEYLRERIVDLRDVAQRIIQQLGESPQQDAPLSDGPVILVARELLPSQTANLDKYRIAGIVTEHGGATGHAAIIARSMGIPAVSGIPDMLAKVKTGDVIVLDGREGCVLLHPGPEAEAAYRKLQREFFDLKDYLIENRDQPAITADGTAIELLANINNVSDAKAAIEVGAKGIGLYRTEYLFMTHPDIPSEEEQYQVYKQILESSPNQRLTIRTLDLGGDKTVAYLGAHREANPFMGFRSIRLLFEHPEVFMHQLRAILRVARHGKVRLMFPMIATVEELRRANRAVWRAQHSLEQENIPFESRVERGFMLEVPAATVCLDHLVRHADFVCIGTNDLVQYIMAADRDNPKVAHLCDPLHPAVLRVLQQAIETCRAHGIPVTVCGEMAGRPRAVLALLGLGLTSFSMSPAFVPMVKELVHSIHLPEARDLANQLVKKRSASKVRECLYSFLSRSSPRIAQLESSRA